jgi:hypothetical protein
VTATYRRSGARVWLGAVALLALALVTLASAACGTTTARPPALHAGTFTSDAYHFRLSYPDGWKLTTLPDTSPAIPLTLQITHTSILQASASFVSTLALSVVNIHDPAEATPVALLQKQLHAAGGGYQAITLAGRPGFQNAPTQQTSPDGKLTITHTEYYLFAGTYEYAFSTDVVSGDGADGPLQQMLQSFALLS